MYKENESLRILLLFTIMNRGGAESMVMNYYRKMDRSKIQFDFLVHRPEKGAFEDEIISLGGRIFRMPPIFPQNYFEYRKKIKEFFSLHKEYRIIHSHMSELGYWAFKEAKRQGIPVRICHAHNTPDFSKLGFREQIKRIPRWYFKTRIRKLTTDMFMCGIESGIWLFGKHNSNKFVMMKNVIDAKRFQYNVDIRNRIRENLGLKDQFVIGHVGRFNEQKNHSFLIDIFYEIYKKNSNSTLLLIGDGPLKDNVLSKVKSRNLMKQVRFLGIRNDINDLMQAMDVFLLPSLFEGLPVVLVEAQASGLPCYTSEKVVTKDSSITTLVKYISVKESANSWAQIILNGMITFNRKSTYFEITRNGWDIDTNVDWLQNYYLNE